MKTILKYVVIVVIIAFIAVVKVIFSDEPFVQTENQPMSAKKPNDLLARLISENEYFQGSGEIKYTGINHDVAEIIIENYATGDDSTTAWNDRYIAKNNGNTWSIVSTSRRWKCRGILSSWVTHRCS